VSAHEEDPKSSPLETERLSLRWLREDDAPFILELVTEPSFFRHIGDKGVRNDDDARRYIRDAHLDSYRRHGFGVYRVASRDPGPEGAGEPVPVGICGLMKRDFLPDPDLGFAFLAAHRSKGYAHESARAVLRHGREVLGLGRVVAMVSFDNHASIKLLGKLGMEYEGRVRPPEEDKDLALYALSLSGRGSEPSENVDAKLRALDDLIESCSELSSEQWSKLEASARRSFFRRNQRSGE